MSVTADQLQHLIPLGDFSDSVRQQLVEQSHVLKLGASETVLALDKPENKLVYVLEGLVEWQDDAGIRRRLDGRSKEALMPLSRSGKHSDVIAAIAVVILVVDNNLLDLLARDDILHGIEVEEIDDTEIETVSNYFHKIYQDYLGGKLVMPEMPELALRIRSAIQDPKNGPHDVARILQADPTVTGRIIQVANSPMYRATHPISDGLSAVTRLGLRTTRDLVVAFTLQRTFKPKHPLIKQRLKQMWQHSGHVAAIANVLAQSVRGIDPEQAMLAGLLHDIGILPLLTFVEKEKLLVARDDILDLMLRKLRGQLGALVLSSWGFGDEFITVALETEDWQRDPAPTADYCDVVIVAQLHSFAQSQIADAYPHISQVPAFGKLGLGKLGPDESIAILEKADSEIKKTHSLLV